MIQIFAIIILSIAQLVNNQQPGEPISFTIVRNIEQPLNIEQFMKKTGFLKTTTQQSIGYNIISLDGFKSSSNKDSITQGASPVAFWSNAYTAIMGSRYTNAGNSTTNVQRYLLQQYHQANVKLLFNALSNQAPVSIANTSPVILANNIANTIQQTQLDGVSIQFNDYFAVANDEDQASPWLKVFLSTLKTTIASDKIIILIIPSTFVKHISFFKESSINSYVNYFVLKYYDTNLQDHNTYQNLFISSSRYPGSSFMEIMSNQQNAIDMCKVLIGKTASNRSARALNGFMEANTLNSAFQRIYNRVGWFAGFANLDFETDMGTTFQSTALASLRRLCRSNGNCFCN